MRRHAIQPAKLDAQCIQKQLDLDDERIRREFEASERDHYTKHKTIAASKVISQQADRVVLVGVGMLPVTRVRVVEVDAFKGSRATNLWVTRLCCKLLWK